MKKYKLKEEAKKFISVGYHNISGDEAYWESQGFTMAALEEKTPVFITYGHATQQSKDVMVHHTSGWSNDRARFHFTININEIMHSEYSNITENHVKDLIKKIQETTTKFLKTIKK